MSLEIGCLVEGHGEELALPKLLIRIAHELDPPVYDLRVAHTLRRKSGSFVWTKDSAAQAREVSRSVELLNRKMGRRGAILALFDADDRCPAEEGPKMLERLRAAAGKDVPSAFVFASREYETWFMHAADSIRGYGGFRTPPSPVPAPGRAGDAKTWLRRHLKGGKYEETTDQAPLTSLLSIRAARENDSFDKLCRELERLLRELRARG